MIDASLRERWQRGTDGWASEVPAGWMQGRSAFGGLTAAAMAALGHQVARAPSRALRTMSTQLLAPVVPGEVGGTAQVLRAGRNITFVEVRLHQRDEVVAVSNLVFGKDMASALDVAGPTAPVAFDPESGADLPYIPDLVPEFTQHVRLRWIEGGMPFSGSERAEFTGAFRYRVPLGDAEGVLALLDTWPAPTLALSKGPTAASTVSWNAHLLRTPDSFEQWFTMRYQTVVGRGGLHTVVGHLFDAGGALVGWSEQLVAVFG